MGSPITRPKKPAKLSPPESECVDVLLVGDARVEEGLAKVVKAEFKVVGSGFRLDVLLARKD